MLARHLLVHGAFVSLQVPLFSERLFAPVEVARERLHKRVRDAVPNEIAFPTESLLAEITHERSSVVHSLVSSEIVSIIV